MNWFYWALLSAIFAGITAVLAKAGVEGVNSHLATAIRTAVILVFTWAIALSVVPMSDIGEHYAATQLAFAAVFASPRLHSALVSLVGKHVSLVQTPLCMQV